MVSTRLAGRRHGIHRSDAVSHTFLLNLDCKADVRHRQEDDITKIQYKRRAQSFYLSSLETIFAAHQQLAHPTPTRAAPTGAFSSRFVTVCLTGSEEGGVDILAFQVTEQAVAMVQADMIEASVDPGTVRVKREEGDRYVPDVFYR